MSEPRYDHHFPLARSTPTRQVQTIYTSQIDLARFHQRSLDQLWYDLLSVGEDGLVRYGETLIKSKNQR